MIDKTNVQGWNPEGREVCGSMWELGGERMCTESNVEANYLTY